MSDFFPAGPIPGMLQTLVSVQRKKRAPPPSSASTMDFVKVSSGSSKTASLLQSVKNFPHKKRKSTGGTAVVDYDPNTLEALEVHDVLREVEELQGNILELETLYTDLPPNFFDAGYTRANLREYLLTKLPDVGEMHRDPAPAVPTVAAIPPPAPPALDETQGRRHLANFLHSPHPMTCGGDPVTPFELLLDGVDLLRQTWNTQHHMALYRTPLLTTKPVMLCDNYRQFMLIRLIWGVLFTFADHGADPNFVGNYKDQRGIDYKQVGGQVGRCWATIRGPQESRLCRCPHCLCVDSSFPVPRGGRSILPHMQRSYNKHVQQEQLLQGSFVHAWYI